MRTDHRRPLVAYVLVTVAGALVVAPSLDLGGLGVGERPTIGAYSDPLMTPSELADQIYEPPLIDGLPDAEIVEQPGTDEGDALAPGIDVIEDVLGGSLLDTTEPVTTDAGTTDPGAIGSGAVLGGSGPLEAGLVAGGGSAAGGNGPDQGQDSAPSAPDAGPDTSAGAGLFDGAPPSNGGPSASPGADGGIAGTDGDGGGAVGPEDGHGNGNGNGHGHGNAAAPHSFDHVPAGAHPYGQVGPKPGQDKKDKGPKGHGRKGDQDKSQGKAHGDRKSQGKAHGKRQGRGQGRSHR